ncbi:MAG: HEPN domain-containing protein [Chloroflexota bacterium]|nr:HEPN domain-containing protein [Chloroflexota bacterium]
MGPAERHLDRARLYLDRALENLNDQQYLKAATALRQSVTHAASSVLAKQGRPTHTRRRLRDALAELVHAGSIPHAHLRTFNRVHDLPALLLTASLAESRRLLLTMRLRVKSLVRDVTAAVNDGESWPALEESPLPGLLCDLPQLREMHAAIPARCNNLALPLGTPPGARVAYNPQVCPGCANLLAAQTPHNLRLKRLYTMNLA